MTRRKGKRREPKRLAVPLAELQQILERTRTGPLEEGEHATLKAAVDTLALVTQELESKQTSLERLRRLLFGPRTEKTDAVLGARDAEAAGEAKTPASKPKKRKGHGRNGADDYPRAERIPVAHASLAPGDPCPESGCEGGKLYLQRKAPAVLVRVTGVAPLKATVYELARLRCHLCGTVFTAEPPAGVGPEKYDETAAAMIALMKYGCGLPFNRLQRLQHNLAIPLPAATQWEVVQRAAGLLEGAYTELIRQAAQGEVLHNDDTTAHVLEMTQEARAEALPAGAREDRTGIFTTGIVAACDGHKIALFMTGPRHAGENLAKVLEQREPARPPPIQMSDGLSRNAPGEHPTVAASCLPHARRQYVDVAAHFPEECRYVLETLRKVFHNDKIAREEELSAEQRLLLHQYESAPLMEELEQWMTQQFEERRVEPNSGLGKAIAYMQNRWQELTVFLRVAGAPLSNNICERILKKAILHRKNSLFFKTLNGARVADIFMSLIHTAELCRAEPFDYLVALQRHSAAVLLDPSAWMPWNYTEALVRAVAADDADPAGD
jgi:transposase